MKRMIALDGAQGEGGGQILRSALSLSDPPDGVPFSMAAGVSAAPFLEKLLCTAREKYATIQGHVYAIENDFFGRSINVSGLITGQDLIAQLRGKDLGERLLISPRFHRTFQQGLVDIHAVNHGIGIAETLAEHFAGFNFPHLVFINGIVHHHVVRVDSTVARFLADTQGVECVESVRTQLDTSTNFTNFRCLLKHRDLKTLAHQSQSSGQTAYTPTSDKNGQIRWLFCCHVCFQNKVHKSSVH